MGQRKQYAALPYVVREGCIEVCLISSRDTGRWIIPKGWPQKSLRPHELAAREAFEEAGLYGPIERKALGRFRYDKCLDDGTQVACDVGVYAMLVESQAVDWPEKDQRTLQWVGLQRATDIVDDAGLADLLRTFRPRQKHLSGTV